jgi:SAM-dependent methyltransferase
MVERLTPEEPAWAEFSPAHLARYLFAAPFAAGGRVLDAGCGSGYGCRLLREAGAADVVGADIHQDSIRRAEQAFGGDGIRFVVDDCEELGLVGGPFDLVCSFESIEHLRRPERFLAAAAKMLSGTGMLILSTPDRAHTPPFVNGRPHNRFHTFEWYRDEFRALLLQHFEEVDMRVQVESTGLRRRSDAAARLGAALSRWPLSIALGMPSRTVKELAAPSIGDYPIVSERTATLFGAPAFHVAVCRQPSRNLS